MMGRQRPRDDGTWRLAMIEARVLLAVLHGLGAVRNLSRQRAQVPLAHGIKFALRWTHRQAAAAAVVADAVVGTVHDDGPVVDVGDVNIRDVVDRAVVHEAVIVPVAAVIAGAGVSVAIGHAAIEAYV
jgi:hypothetical protein